MENRFEQDRARFLSKTSDDAYKAANSTIADELFIPDSVVSAELLEAERALVSFAMTTTLSDDEFDTKLEQFFAPFYERVAAAEGATLGLKPPISLVTERKKRSRKSP